MASKYKEEYQVLLCTSTQSNENRVNGDDKFEFWVAGEILLFLIQDLLTPRQQYR